MIDKYNSMEQQAIMHNSNRIIQAFCPTSFNTVGYPTHVNKISELIKYVDVMNPNGFIYNYNRLNGLTEHEFDLYKQLSNHVYDFSNKYFNKPMIAKNSIMRSIYQLRKIYSLFNNNESFNVFEVGPGCGYLGALCILEGIPYMATDVSQAFYIYQNYFWNFITNNCVVEYVDNLSDVLQPIGGHPVHIPWWKFAELRYDTGLSFDVVTCNHVVGEMHINSLYHTLRFSYDVQKNNLCPFFVIDGLYNSYGCSLKDITKCFYDMGYWLIYHNDYELTLFSLVECSNDGMVLPRCHVSLYEWFQDVFRYLLKLDSLRDEQLWKVNRFVDNNYSGFKNDDICIFFDDVCGFNKELLGSNVFLTDDDLFLDWHMDKLNLKG